MVFSATSSIPFFSTSAASKLPLAPIAAAAASSVRLPSAAASTGTICWAAVTMPRSSASSCQPRALAVFRTAADLALPVEAATVFPLTASASSIPLPSLHARFVGCGVARFFLESSASWRQQPGTAATIFSRTAAAAISPGAPASFSFTFAAPTCCLLSSRLSSAACGVSPKLKCYGGFDICFPLAAACSACPASTPAAAAAALPPLHAAAAAASAAPRSAAVGFGLLTAATARTLYYQSRPDISLFSAAALSSAIHAASSSRRSFYSQRSAGLKVPRYQRIYAMTAKELRHAVADAARRQLRMHDLWDAFLYRACVLRSELSPEQVASLFHSLAAVEKPLLSFVDFILEDVRRRCLHRFRLQDASLLLAALSRLQGARDPLLLHALLPVLLKRLQPPGLSESSSSSSTTEDTGSRRNLDDCSRSRSSRNQLSTLKHIALLAHAYVKLKGPQADLLLSRIAARLASPVSPLLPPLQQHRSLLDAPSKRRTSSSNDAHVNKKKNKIRMPQCLALLLGAFAAHARSVFQRNAAAAASHAVAAAAFSPAAAALPAAAVGDVLDSEEEKASAGLENEENSEEDEWQQIPFAATVETLLEHSVLQLSEFSPRDCSYFLRALADIAACDSSRSNSGSSSKQAHEGLLLLGGVTGLRGILNSVYRRLLRLRFELKSSECVMMLTGAWLLEELLAAAPTPIFSDDYGHVAAAAGYACESRGQDWPSSGCREGDVNISHTLLQELFFRAADMPAATVLDALRMLVKRKELSSREHGGNTQVYPALEAALLSRLGTLLPSLFYFSLSSTEAKRRSLLATPAAIMDLLRQLCMPRMQPYLPPSFAPAAVSREPALSPQGRVSASLPAAAAAAARYSPPPRAATARATTLAAAAEVLTPCVSRQAAAMARPPAAAAEAGGAAEAAAAGLGGGVDDLFSEEPEPMYSLSKAAGSCMRCLLAALAASGNVKRLLNLQTAAALCWTCAALRVRDPLLERLLLQHRNFFLPLAATGAAAAAQKVGAAGEASHRTETKSVVLEEPWRAAVAAAGAAADTSQIEVEKGRSRAEDEELETATSASREGAAAEREGSVDEEDDLEAAAALSATEESKVALLQREPLFLEKEAAAATPIRGGGVQKETSAALATLAAGLACLGMADTADALAVFPLLATVENFTEVETALSVLVAATVFDLTRRPKTLASSLLHPAAEYVYQQRAALLLEQYASLIFIGSSSLPRAFPLHTQQFFINAWRCCSPLHPVLHRSRVQYGRESAANVMRNGRSVTSDGAGKSLPHAATSAASHCTFDPGRCRAAEDAGEIDPAVETHAISSSAAAVSPRLYAVLVRAAPHRYRVSTGDLLQVACTRGKVRQPNSSEENFTTVEDVLMRGGLLRMQSKDVAEQLLYRPFPAAPEGSVQVASATPGYAGTGRAPSAGGTRTVGILKSSTPADNFFHVKSSPTEEQLREGRWKMKAESDGDENVDVAVGAGQEERERRDSVQQWLEDHKKVTSFPERVRHHLQLKWKGIKLYREIYVPSCNQCLPFAIDLQSLSQHLAALDTVDRVRVATDNDANAYEIGETAAPAVGIISPKSAAKEVAVSIEKGGRPRRRGFRDRRRRENSRVSGRHANRAIRRETFEDKVILKMEERNKNQVEHEGGRNQPKKLDDGCRSTDDDTRSVRRWRMQRIMGADVSDGTPKRQRGRERARRKRSACRLLQEEKQVTADDCGVKTTNRRSWNRKCGRHESMSIAGGGICEREELLNRDKAREASQNVGDGVYEDNTGIAWATVDCVVIRKETHALVDLLWKDFDFLREAPAQKVNVKGFDERNDKGGGAQRICSPVLWPGKASELNALKHQGWAVFCLSETTWRAIENSRAGGRKEKQALQADLKLYVMQCVAGLSRAVSHKDAQQQQQRKEQHPNQMQ